MLGISRGAGGTQENGLETSGGLISNSIKKELIPPLLYCHCCAFLSLVFLSCWSRQMWRELWKGINQRGHAFSEVIPAGGALGRPSEHLTVRWYLPGVPSQRPCRALPRSGAFQVAHSLLTCLWLRISWQFNQNSGSGSAGYWWGLRFGIYVLVLLAHGLHFKKQGYRSLLNLHINKWINDKILHVHYVHSQPSSFICWGTLTYPPRPRACYLQPAVCQEARVCLQPHGPTSALEQQLPTLRSPYPQPVPVPHQVAFDVKMKRPAHLGFCPTLPAPLPRHQSLQSSHGSKLKAGLPSSCCNRFCFTGDPKASSAQPPEETVGPAKWSCSFWETAQCPAGCQSLPNTPGAAWAESENRRWRALCIVGVLSGGGPQSSLLAQSLVINTLCLE